jgi:thiol-disulfide isomerase/thioredoxin
MAFKKFSILFLLFISTTLFSKTLYFFEIKGCKNCEREKVFLEKLKKKYPNLEIKNFDASKNKKLLKEISEKLNIDVRGFPITIIGKKYFIGFLSEETTGKEMEKALLDYKNREDPIKDILLQKKDLKYEKAKSVPEFIKIPFFGEIEIKKLSLPLLTIILGLIDGFNPCAMWALLMLISFLINIKNRKKMILLGTIFIFFSAIVYLMFMMAWLNFIFFFQHIGWIKIVVGLVAVFGGIFYLKEFFKNKKGICKVTSPKYKKYVSEKLAIFTQDKIWLAILGIILLAFSVNLIELICSAGLPVVYIQVLSMSNLSPLVYYLYIGLYIFVFMLDDLFIFLVAVFSLEMIKLTAKYSRVSHLIGGVVLLIIGILLIFKPGLLMF